MIPGRQFLDVSSHSGHTVRNKLAVYRLADRELGRSQITLNRYTSQKRRARGLDRENVLSRAIQLRVNKGDGINSFRPHPHPMRKMKTRTLQIVIQANRQNVGGKIRAGYRA